VAIFLIFFYHVRLLEMPVLTRDNVVNFFHDQEVVVCCLGSFGIVILPGQDVRLVHGFG